MAVGPRDVAFDTGIKQLLFDDSTIAKTTRASGAGNTCKHDYYYY